MAEAKLNKVLSAETQVNGEIRCRVNITTPEGYDWETDYIVYLGLQVSADALPADTSEPRGLQKDITDWVLANPDEVKPFTLAEGPVERKDPVCLNPDPEPEPPPPDELREALPEPEIDPPATDLSRIVGHDGRDVSAKMTEPQLKLEPDPEE